MQAEQGRTQHGHERRNLRIHVREVGYQQRKAGNEQTEGHDKRKAAHQKARNAQHANGQQEHRLKTIAHRHETGQIPAESKPQRQANKGGDDGALENSIEPRPSTTTHLHTEGQEPEGEAIHKGDLHGRDTVVDDLGRDACFRQLRRFRLSRQGTNERALVEHHDQPHFLVSVLNGARQGRRRVAFGGHQSLQTVFAAGIQLCHRGIIAHDAQPLAQSLTFDAHHGHILPLVGIVHPREQDLFGSESAKTRFAGDFFTEIHSQGVERTDATVVNNLSPADAVGLAAGDGAQLSVGKI